MLIGLGLLTFDLISIESFDVVFAIAMGNTALVLMMKAGISRATSLIWAIGVPITSLGLQLIFPHIRLSPYLAIVVINLFVAYIFGRGLSTDRTPLIVQLIRISNSGPEGPRDFQNYVYGQGRVWTAFGLLTAACGFLAMIFLSLREALNPVISTLFITQISWFVLAHYWARLRYKRKETWFGTIRLMSRNDIWMEFEI